MRFIRFVLARRHSDSGLEDGMFGLTYELRDSPDVGAADRDLLGEAFQVIAGPFSETQTG